jgi:putative selenate reductase
MGIPASLFFVPDPADPFRMKRYGKTMETPVGVAAGPHSQLAMNIVAAWLCGARYIELKTIQTLDDLHVSKPCIDMQDEGYNCEWSQELRLDQSFTEYLNAWILIHLLHKELGFKGADGTIFNMSVGYDLEGILKPNVQDFLSRMQDCSKELEAAKTAVRMIYPAISEINIPSCISDSITLSTMHGCPPQEISRIGQYLIGEKNLHTTIKLNPTLLGAEPLRSLLNRNNGFSATVPDLAFEHDLKYPDAVEIIKTLSLASSGKGLQFSIKLTNTLECMNTGKVFDEKEKM